MKLAFKKYLYLVNDLTNFLLKKEKDDLIEKMHQLRLFLIMMGVILILSIALNIYFIFT
jgi:hypothetical protein